MKRDDGMILVVDDDPMNRDMLARRLQRRGYRTQEAESGKQALQILERHDDIDLVLLDIEMPEMDGIEVLTRVRQSRLLTELPVIMVTARSDSADVVQALGAGANDYVSKPVDYPVALARIRTHLSLKRAEQALRDSEERYALAARGANDGLWDWCLEKSEIYLSPRWRSMLGLNDTIVRDDPEEWFNRVHPEDLAGLKREIEAHIRGHSPFLESEHRVVHEDGSHRWMLSRGLAVRNAAGKAIRMAGSLTDVTAGKIVDPLTGLPNKLLFSDRLGRFLERARRKSGYRFAVLLLDLDRFKIVNDSLGHAVGDRLLVGAAQRLKRCIRSVDTVGRSANESTLARLGGDEFMLLLEDVQRPADASAVAARVHKQLQPPFDLDGDEVTTGVSIGIVTGGDEYERPEELLRDADTAMNRAKARGGGVSEVFESEMHGRALTRLRLEIDLRKALERDEMQVHYQPIVSLGSQRIVGFEALVRWQHPQRGLLPPAEFIPLAEETGLIVPLGHWILARACRQTRDWQTAFPQRPPLMISANLCARHLVEPDLLEDLGRVLETAGLVADSLKLEITESVIMEDPDCAAVTLDRIRAMGIRLAIDDFGTGYSSLTYLHQFPIDTLKIDRSFTGRIDSAQEGLEIVRTIMDLAHNLGMDVIAEGVESAGQLALLRELGCEYAQGFLFSKPVDVDAAAALLRAGILREGCVSS